MISAAKIDLHTLPTDLLEVFSPLLCEMEEIGTTLDRDEFLDASLRLYTVSLLISMSILMFFVDSEHTPKEPDPSL